MKDSTADSFFFFRRSSQRYSLFLEWHNKTENKVQLKRASWSSFPLLRFSPSEDKLGKETVASKSQSTEDIKSPLHGKPGRGFFKESASSIKSILSTPTSNSSSSSSSNMRSGQSSGNSSITNILEESTTSDECYESSHSVEEECQDSSKQKLVTLCTGQCNGDVAGRPSWIKHPTLAKAKSSTHPKERASSGKEIISFHSPKVVFIHRKTPDAKRKTRKQIVQELKFIEENGILPDEYNVTLIRSEAEKENEVPSNEKIQRKNLSLKRNFRLIPSYKFLSRFDGRKGTEQTQPERTASPEHLSLQEEIKPFLVSENAVAKSSTEANVSSSQQLSENGAVSVELPVTAKEASTYIASSITEKSSTMHGVNEDSDCGTPGGQTLENDRAHQDHELQRRLDKSDCQNNVGETLEGMENNDGEHEDNVSHNQKENSPCSVDAGGNQPSPSSTPVLLREGRRAQLKLSLKKAQKRGCQLSHISEDGSDKSSTPKSPAIDIDVLFEERQRELDEGQDSMSRVRNLTQKLRLSTASCKELPVWRRVDRSPDAGIIGAEVHEDTPTSDPADNPIAGIGRNSLSHEQRKLNMKKAIEWLRRELSEMQSQDQQLARQLISLQLEMQKLRLLKSCSSFQALLEEVTFSEEEIKAFMTFNLCESPPDLRECFSSALRDVGVTRMNITNRRFSLR